MNRYAVTCAILCGLANFIVWVGYSANVFISESVLHSVNGREPDRIGAHDGYYGLAVSNAASMLSTLAVPIIMNYFRSKWILTLGGACFTFYFISFQFVNRYLYFVASVFLGAAFSCFNLGYSGYLTEFSTRQTIERNYSLMWAVSCLNVFGAGIVNFVVTTVNLSENGIVSKYREYSDTEIMYFYAAFSIFGLIGTAIYACLPNKDVDNNIAASNVRIKSIKEQLYIIFSVLVDKRVLIMVPFYLYSGMFFSFWCSIIPTTLQFTKVLSLNVYLAAYFGIAFTLGSVIMCLVTMYMSKVMSNFSFKPLMLINATIHILVFLLTAAFIPEWSTVRPNDEPSLLIEPSVYPVLALAFLCGLADAANSTTRTVISSLLVPTRRQQTFGASRFYHALAASVILFASPSLSIYTYVIILSAFLVVATTVYLYSCHYIENQERKVHAEGAMSTEDYKTLETVH